MSGKPLFVAPIGRSMDEFLAESNVHGWPSFRDQEVVWENMRVLKSSGEAVSADGTHLGHNLPDRNGNRYCINVSAASAECCRRAQLQHGATALGRNHQRLYSVGDRSVVVAVPQALAHNLLHKGRCAGSFLGSSALVLQHCERLRQHQVCGPGLRLAAHLVSLSARR